jgi:hypothetical protein
MVITGDESAVRSIAEDPLCGSQLTLAEFQGSWWAWMGEYCATTHQWSLIGDPEFFASKIDNGAYVTPTQGKVVSFQVQAERLENHFTGLGIGSPLLHSQRQR